MATWGIARPVDAADGVEGEVACSVKKRIFGTTRGEGKRRN